MRTDHSGCAGWVKFNKAVSKQTRRVIKHTLAAWLLFCSTLGMAEADNQGFAQTVKQIKPTVVGVGTMQYNRRPAGEFHGTGFAVADGNHVVTNAHVLPPQLDLEEEEFLAVFVGKGDRVRARRARVKINDPEHDLALLWVEGRPLPAVKLASPTSEAEGSDLAFTGFPLGTILGMYPATHRGTLASVTPIVIADTDADDIDPHKMGRFRSRYLVYQLDANAYPGNSGSPVYRPLTGAVVGVVNKIFVQDRKRHLQSQPSGITYAIPVEHVHRLLIAAGLSSKTASEGSMPAR